MKHIIDVITTSGYAAQSRPLDTETASFVAAGLYDPDDNSVITMDTRKLNSADSIQVMIPVRAVAAVRIEPPLWVAGRMEKVTPGAVFAIDPELSADYGHAMVVEVQEAAVKWAPVACRQGAISVRDFGRIYRPGIQAFTRHISPTTMDELTDAGGAIPRGWSAHFPMWTDE